MTAPDPAPEYVAARRTLLDALTALRAHTASMILVGAQAVYHHTGESDLVVPLLTSDGDLAIDTSHLDDEPEIGRTLREAGFVPGNNPGHWISTSDVVIDLMVVPHQAGVTRTTARAARLLPHEKRTARITRGLEAALVDSAIHRITALEPGDSRAVDLKIAGPAALLTAKAIKIGERLTERSAQRQRALPKDALDAFRILQAVDAHELIRGFELHQTDHYAAVASSDALNIYRTHAASPDGQIPRLAATAARHDPTVAPAFAALIGELLSSL